MWARFVDPSGDGTIAKRREFSAQIDDAFMTFVAFGSERVHDRTTSRLGKIGTKAREIRWRSRAKRIDEIANCIDVVRLSTTQTLVEHHAE